MCLWAHINEKEEKMIPRYRKCSQLWFDFGNTGQLYRFADLTNGCLFQWVSGGDIIFGIKIDDENAVSMALTGDDKYDPTSFVFTGELSSYSRVEAGEIIRKFGGKVSSSVSRLTDYVVAGGNPGTKLNKAKKLGVNIIDEKKFKELCKL